MGIPYHTNQEALRGLPLGFKMKNIKDLLAPYKSYYAASKHLGPSINQLKRWELLGAEVDNTGQVWIKTGQPIKL
jgi:hypothetical protein